MIDNFEIFKNIIENNGREGYITDEKFNVVWTNSDKSLIELLLNSNHGNLVEPKSRETAIACSDGTALKITPLIVGEKPIGYVFERFESNQIVDLLSKTSVFRRFSEECNTFREAVFELMTQLYLQNDDNSRKLKKAKIDDMYSNSVNKTNMLKILSYDLEPQIFDLYVPISYCCGVINMSSKTADYEISTELQQGVYIFAHYSSFEYVFMNLLLNAYSYCDAKKKKIIIRTYCEADKSVMEISDNGQSCDIEKIKSFKTIFGSEKKSESGEGLGIAIAQVYADKNNCELSFANSESGGLSVKMSFPYHVPHKDISLCAPPADRSDFSIFDLLKKCFGEEETQSLKSKLLK